MATTLDVLVSVVVTLDLLNLSRLAQKGAVHRSQHKLIKAIQFIVLEVAMLGVLSFWQTAHDIHTFIWLVFLFWDGIFIYFRDADFCA